MKQNQKGFTLIELLAVIVILAIIALIAVPVIMNIITSARKSAFEDTAYGIIKAGELYYANSLLNDGMPGNVEFTFSEGTVSPKGLSIQGSLPQSGKLVVTRDGKVALAITNGAMCITKGYDDSKIDLNEDVDNCVLPAEPAKKLRELAKTNDFATTVHECATAGITCTTGEKFAIEVAPGNIRNFYVVSDISNKVTLIMDRNIDETIVAWNSSGEKSGGPITALNHLESQTREWTNIPAKTYTLADDQGQYTIERTNARARMLTITEATAVGCTGYYNGSSATCPNWLFGNLGTSNPPYAYWLSSALAVGSNRAWRADRLGRVDNDDVSNDSVYGVRPVIEISK